MIVIYYTKEVNKMKLKKIIAAALSVTMLCGAPAAVGTYQPGSLYTASAADIIDSGTCGDSVTWTLDSEGTLTISGTGDMDINSGAEWLVKPDAIKKVVIENGVNYFLCVCCGAE